MIRIQSSEESYSTHNVQSQFSKYDDSQRQICSSLSLSQKFCFLKFRRSVKLTLTAFFCLVLIIIQSRLEKLQSEIKAIKEKRKNLLQQWENAKQEMYFNSLLESDIIIRRKRGQDAKFKLAERLELPDNVLWVNKAIYVNNSIAAQRRQFNEERIQFLDKYSDQFPEIKTAKFTMKTHHQRDEEQKRQLDVDYNRLNKKYDLSLYEDEFPLCIIMLGRNNNANFRIEYSLNSVFLQNYTDYHALVVDDVSTDGSQDIYRRYFDFYDIEASKAMLILNKKRLTSLQNFYVNTMAHCKKDQIGIQVDNDDEVFGRNVFKFFNTLYHKKPYGFVYSQTLLKYNIKHQIKQRYLRANYTDDQKFNQTYRQSDAFFFQIRTFRVELLYQIDPKDMQDDKGHFFRVGQDGSLFFPIIELSCGNTDYIPEKNYFYNLETGANDSVNIQDNMVNVDLIIRSRPAYPCSKIYGSYKNKAEKDLAEASKKVQK